MTGGEFEERLQVTLTEGGIPFKRAHFMFDTEKEYGLATLKFGIHRLLPVIQPFTKSMPDAWVGKWKVLDDSLELTIRALRKDLGKGVGDAYADFVHAKFPFGVSSTFPMAP